MKNPWNKLGDRAKFVIIGTVIILIFMCAAKAGDIRDGLGLDSAVSKEELNYTCDPLPPPKPPAQMSGGEGVPPLPLPAVPIRRTEKKNPPRPPVLVIKIITDRDADWNTNPNDVENLLKWMSKELDVNFSSQNKRLNDVLGFKEERRMAEKK